MFRMPCPASNTLERLWKEHPATHQPISEVARLTLEAWDGAGEVSAAKANRREMNEVRLRATLRTFPSSELLLSMIVPGRASSGVEEAEILDADDQVVASFELVPYASGWLGVGDDAAIDVASFLSGQVRLRRQGQQQPLRRRPRRLIALRWDDLLQSYLECERVQLGEESLAISRSEIAQEVQVYLDEVARPGFRRISEVPGLPTGWILFEGVQIVSSGRRGLLVDLNVLQPITRSQVVLQGGLRLPGHLRKWLSSRPPEVRVFNESGGRLEATLTCTRPLAMPSPKSVTYQGEGSALIWDLGEAYLTDGDYELKVSDDGQTVGTEILRLRSADNPALQLNTSGSQIVHDPSQPGYGLVAVRSGTTGSFQGVPTTIGTLTDSEPPSIPGWLKARTTGQNKRIDPRLIRFPSDAPSCIETGGHYMDLPIGIEGQSSIEGVCRNCGLVKRYPTRFRKRKKKVGARPPCRHLQ